MTVILNHFNPNGYIKNDDLWYRKPSITGFLDKIKKMGNKNVTFNPVVLVKKIESEPAKFRKTIFFTDAELILKRPESSRFSRLNRGLNSKTEFFKPLPLPKPIGAMSQTKPEIKGSLPDILMSPPQPNNIESEELFRPPLPLPELFAGIKPEDIIDDGTMPEDQFLAVAGSILKNLEKMRDLIRIA